MNEGMAQVQRALQSIILKHNKNPVSVLLISQQLVHSWQLEFHTEIKWPFTAYLERTGGLRSMSHLNLVEQVYNSAVVGFRQ